MTAPGYFAPGDDLPTFGQKVAGQHYQPRPGAYALIFQDPDLVALIQTIRGFFLPGGGAETGETPAETVQREVLEECGCEIVTGAQLGLAVDYMFAENEAKYYEIQSVFLLARLGKQLDTPGEADHQLVWLKVSQAHTLLNRPSQKWALQKACASF